jgi:dolichol-phosphate mannosyltransferase
MQTADSACLQLRTAQDGSEPAETPELTIVIPTLNERNNIRPLLEALDAVLAGIRWEVIFVDDDSADGTADEVRSIARRDGRVRCLQRIGRRGLSTACIEGALASSCPYIAVMDADMQHDERLLPRMLDTLKSDECDLVVGSRYIAGGGIGEWDRTRANVSSLATRLSRLICKAEIADPMSGFFMLRREAFADAMRGLSGQGFKILLDLLASSSKGLRIKELPFQFRPRRNGASKLDTMVILEFGLLLADKVTGGIITPRLALFGLIGALDLLAHIVVLWAGLRWAAASFVVSQALATAVVIGCNFPLYRLTRISGAARGSSLIAAVLRFCGISAIGGAANVAIGSLVFSAGGSWWIAGIAGALIGMLWNYAVSPAAP